jgi:hypothetical protein
MSVETSSDPFSLSALVAWLEKQPGETEYDFLSCDDCLVARYLRDVMGWDDPSGKTRFASHFGGSGNYFRIACDGAWTLGAALIRARSLLTSSNGGSE